MCGKGESQYSPKYFCGCIAIMVVVIVILAVYISVSGNSGASVEMTGENESAVIEESSGIHLIEVNGADLGSIDGKGWSYMEIGFIVLGFIFVLNLTHISHYCIFTKKMVKRKVTRDVQLEMGKLPKAPMINEAVIVPGLA